MKKPHLTKGFIGYFRLRTTHTFPQNRDG